MNLEALEYLTTQGCSAKCCNHDGHDKLYLHARCHVSGGIEVSFKSGNDFILIACLECKEEIARIEVASNDRPLG